MTDQTSSPWQPDPAEVQLTIRALQAHVRKIQHDSPGIYQAVLRTALKDQPIEYERWAWVLLHERHMACEQGATPEQARKILPTRWAISLIFNNGHPDVLEWMQTELAYWGITLPALSARSAPPISIARDYTVIAKGENHHDE